GMVPAQCEVHKERIRNRCKQIRESVWFDWERALNEIRKYAVELSLALISAGLIALVAWLKAKLSQVKTFARDLEDRVFDPFFRRPTLYEQYATNLILIGEGGSGKTTILHALTGSDDIKPDVATNELSTYTLVNEVTIERKGRVVRRLFRIYADDY